MYLAVAGQGATRNGVPIGVSAGGNLSGARLAGPKRYLDHLASFSPGTWLASAVRLELPVRLCLVTS
jgi:hypothetical protein